MTRFSINLASRPFHNNTLHWFGFALVLLGLVLFTWYDVDRFFMIGEERAGLSGDLNTKRAKLVRLSAEADAINAKVAHLDLEGLQARSDFANSIILGRLFSWSTLFDRLEAIQPELVRLKSIRPIVTKNGIEMNLAGAAKDPNGLLDFEDALLNSDYFSLVYPLTETSREKRNETEFTVTFAYLPEGKKAKKERETAAKQPASLDQIFDQASQTEGSGSSPGPAAQDANAATVHASTAAAPEDSNAPAVPADANGSAAPAAPAAPADANGSAAPAGGSQGESPGSVHGAGKDEAAGGGGRR